MIFVYSLRVMKRFSKDCQLPYSFGSIHCMMEKSSSALPFSIGSAVRPIRYVETKRLIALLCCEEKFLMEVTSSTSTKSIGKVLIKEKSFTTCRIPITRYAGGFSLH